MNASAYIWIALVSAAAIAGFVLAYALATSRPLARLLAGLSVLTLGGSGYCVGLLAQGEEGVRAAVYGAVLMILGLGAGWLIASVLLTPRTRPNPRHPKIAPIATGEAPCVLVFSCVEPGTYRLAATRDRIGGLLLAGGLEASLFTLPLLYLAHRSRYDVVGGTNPAAAQLQTCAASISREIGSHDASVQAVDCSRAGSLSDLVAAAGRSGSGACVVVSPSVISTSSEDAALALAQATAAGTGTSMHVVDLGASTDLVRDVLVSLVSRAAVQPDRSGVVLLSMASTHPDHAPSSRTDSIEAAFLGSLSVALVDAGFSENTVRTAWARDSETQALEHVRHIALRGLSRIVVVQAMAPFETLDSVIEVDLARRAVRGQCEIVSVSGWGSDERICSELARRAAQTLSAGTGAAIRSEVSFTRLPAPRN